MAESLWDLYKDWSDIDPAVDLPVSLDAHRVARAPDALTHCQACGGTDFRGVITFAADGTPARVLTPQTCVGCGAHRRVGWPS